MHARNRYNRNVMSAQELVLNHLKIWKRVNHPLKKAPMSPPGQDRQGGSLSALLPLILFFNLDTACTAAHIALAIATVAADFTGSAFRCNPYSLPCHKYNHRLQHSYFQFQIPVQPQ